MLRMESFSSGKHPFLHFPPRRHESNSRFKYNLKGQQVEREIEQIAHSRGGGDIDVAANFPTFQCDTFQPTMLH